MIIVHRLLSLGRIATGACILRRCRVVESDSDFLGQSSIFVRESQNGPPPILIELDASQNIRGIDGLDDM